MRHLRNLRLLLSQDKSSLGFLLLGDLHETCLADYMMKDGYHYAQVKVEWIIVKL